VEQVASKLAFLLFVFFIAILLPKFSVLLLNVCDWLFGQVEERRENAF